MDNMARSRASDKNDPSNFPGDNGLRYCAECGNDIAVDLTNAEETEVEEFTNCYSHLKGIESLREECSRRDTSITGLVYEIAFLKRGWVGKDARIHELETRLADMTRLAELGIKLDEIRREEK